MQAIDFGTRFIKAVIKSELPYYQAGCLLAIAAGLDTAYDIANFYDMPNTRTINPSLKSLAKAGYLVATPDDFAGIDIYRLSDSGKALVKKMFSFLPKR